VQDLYMSIDSYDQRDFQLAVENCDARLSTFFGAIGR
jgi:hypothetical protein